uniref:Phenoloxidase n=1 Tax=Nipponaphis monzeni TaxID=196483 RepID=A0A481MQJ8_9HEMI
MAEKNDILYLFDRPGEPIFTGKGDDNVTLEVPTEYLTERYKPLASDIQKRFPGDRTIRVNKLNTIPDMSVPLGLSRDSPFSVFNPNHSTMASKLIEIFMAAKNVEELISLAAYCHDRINKYMYVYALSVAVLHRQDTRGVDLLSHAEMFPCLYVDSSVFSRAMEETVVVQAGSRTPIEIPFDYTSNNLDIEHRVSYFREDIGINLHHWHWHLVYPYRGPVDIVNKDRRGELFFYMHQQIIARYNMERLSNDMSRVTRLNDWRDPIPEAYFPKLDNVNANRVWPSRPSNSRFKNVDREKDLVVVDIDDLERWRNRIFDAIHSGYIVVNDPKNNDRMRLRVNDGINVLGNIVESSILSPNLIYYGSLHNEGHNVISYIHDPDNRYLENYGVMGEPATAMRDPIFYRWHAYIDDIFQEYKATLGGYSVQDLSFENVNVQSVEVSAVGIQRNELATFWQQSDVDLSRGLDFAPRGSVLARFTHLQHIPFTYKIAVENSGSQRNGTVRIFLGPKFDEAGLPLLFREQRKLFVELDKFSVSLKKGRNEFSRQSTESSVTIPHERTYRNLGSGSRPAENSAALPAFNFCGCGWPQNMLIPKGSPEGYQCQLFVMVSNAANDVVQSNGTAANGQQCTDAASYCGVLNSRYPDARNMGYPFDRVPRDGVATLQQFVTPNMTFQDVRIRFTNRTVAAVQRPAAAPTQTPAPTKAPAKQQQTATGKKPRN